MLIEFEGVPCLIRGDEDFVNFFPGRKPMVSHSQSGAKAFARSATEQAGILGTNNSPPTIFSKLLRTNSTPCSRVMKARHVGIGNGKLTGFPLLREKRNDASATTDDITVTHDGIGGGSSPGIAVGRDENFVGTELGRSIEVHWVDRLVGTEGDDFLDARPNGCLHHVGCPVDIGLDKFVRVVLGGRHLLQGGCVNGVIDPPHGEKQPVLITSVTEEKTQGTMMEIRIGLHLGLFPFVAGIHDQATRPIPLQDGLNEFLTERSSATVINIDLSLSIFSYSLNQFSCL